MTTTTMPAPTTPDRAAVPRGGGGRFTKRKVGGVIVTVITWVLVFLFFFPVLWMLLNSFKSEAGAAAFPPQIVADFSFDRYAAVFERGMGLYLANSAAVSILSTVVVMGLAIPAAYALSVRPIGKWQDALFFFISTRFMPVAASIIPVFLLLQIGRRPGQPVVARRALSRDQPAAGDLDDAVVLRRGPAGRGRGRAGRRGVAVP